VLLFFQVYLVEKRIKIIIPLYSSIPLYLVENGVFVRTLMELRI